MAEPVSYTHLDVYKRQGIGKSCGRNIIAVITNMDEPLGRNVGNALEVIEAVDVLRGNGDRSLREDVYKRQE